MSEKISITFEGENLAPLYVEAGSALSDVLDSPDSPVFFGCKSGNCGTCLIELDPTSFEKFPAPNETEREHLELLASDKPFARLACQLHAICDIRLRHLN